MATRTKTQKFTAEERAAMKERAKELKAAGGENAVLEKIAEMPKADRVLAEKVHAIVKENAPGLEVKTWYGMPAYADGEGKVVCFFRSAAKFKSRDARLQRHGEPRRRRHVADRLRAQGPDRGRGEEDRRAGEEGDRLTGQRRGAQRRYLRRSTTVRPPRSRATIFTALTAARLLGVPVNRTRTSCREPRCVRVRLPST
jgi:uncharacterized protein YdhG (YjbR/CyaY superfamily)